MNPPQSLRDRIEADLVPVKPLPAAWKQALLALPWILLCLLFCLFAFELRHDSETLGLGLTWGLSALAIAFAFFLFALAGREGLPARGLLPRNAALLALAACVFHTFMAWLTYRTSPVFVSDAETLSAALACFGIVSAIGAPLTLLLVLSAARGVCLRPWTAGLLAGLGGALAADAIWRVVCPFTTFDHVLMGHSSGMCFLALLGMAFSLVLARCRRTG